MSATESSISHAVPGDRIDFIERLTGLLFEAVRDHDNPLQAAADRVPAFIAYCDRSDRFLFANRAYEDWFGRRPIGLRTRDAFPTSVYEKAEPAINCALRGSMSNYSVQLLDKAGRERTVRAFLQPHYVDGACVGYFTFMVEATDVMQMDDLRQRTNELRLKVEEQSRQVRSVLDVVADGVLIVREDGSVADMNPAAGALFGIPLHELAGRPFDSLLGELPASLSIRKLLERSRLFGGIDARARDATGNAIPVHVTFSAAGSASGEHDDDQYILVIRDFRTVRSAQKRAVETERLAAIGETMTALAHESRNALQRMQSCLTLLQLRGDSEVQELVADMQDAQDQLQRLYEEVKDFAAPLQLRLAGIDVGHMLEEVWRQLKVQWEPKELVHSQRDLANGPRIQGDELRIGQVFRNILENAIESSPQGGRIVVTLQPGRVDERPGVNIMIDDEGPGIPERMRTQVFNLLFTTKQGGTGMGLAIAQRVIKEHGGEIAIEDSPLSGARIVVGLPTEQSNLAL